MTTPAAFAAASTSVSENPSPAGEAIQTREPRVFFYDDGRHASGLYQFAPPLTPEDFTFTVDQLVEAGVDTLLYSVGTEGGVVQYDSRVAAKWGDNTDYWQHEIYYRASRILRQLISDGHDPMELLSRRCREKRLWFIPTLCVCILGGNREKDGGYGRKSDFVYNNPQFQVGPDDDPRAKKPARFFGPERFNFLHPQVRQERFLIAEELLSRYQTDGLELDLSIDNDFGPFCLYREVSRLAPGLTQWIRNLRTVADKAERAQGRRKRLYVRIPAGPVSTWNLVGFEVPQWVSEKLVDALVCLPTYPGVLEQDLDIGTAVQITRGTRCRILAGFQGGLGRQIETTATPPMTWAAAANAYDRGADGFGLCEGMWTPNGWPWIAEDYQTLRLLGHPNLLATADKVYRARSLAQGASLPEVALFPGAIPALPQSVSEGKSLEIPWRMADDLLCWHALDRVEAIRLRVRFGNFEPDLNTVKVELNGRLLPESILKKVDLHFRVIKPGAIGPYGYIYEYRLTPDFYPRQKDNVLTVTLVKRDPKQGLPFWVYDMDCSVRYRLHRQFERTPIEY